MILLIGLIILSLYPILVRTKNYQRKYEVWFILLFTYLYIVLNLKL